MNVSDFVPLKHRNFQTNRKAIADYDAQRLLFSLKYSFTVVAGLAQQLKPHGLRSECVALTGPP